MKITQFRKNGDTTALSVMDLEKLVNKVKTRDKIPSGFHFQRRIKIYASR